jgi:hypothetical protein
MKQFLEENAPLLTVGLLGAIGLLFVPLAPQSLWSLDNVRKGPYRLTLETTEGRKELRITLEMAIETPEGYVFRASPLERLRGESFPASWAMNVEKIGTATFPCFVSGGRVCTFKIGSRNQDTLAVEERDCQAMGSLLACSGRTEMKAGTFLDISRSDAVVRPVD